jgi:hypothetical protein
MLNKQSVTAESINRSKVFLNVAVSLVAILILLGAIACSSTTKQETPIKNAAPMMTPASTPRPKASTSEHPGKAPNSLVNAGEYGENIYDNAKTNNWSKAAAKLTSLKDAAKQLHAELPDASVNEDQLDGTIAAIEQAITKRDRREAMREANQATRIVADMTAPFSPQVPIDVTRLDYQGRELEIWAEAKDTAKLKATADELQRTWAGLRPQVEAHGGGTVAKKFDNLVERAKGAKTPDEYSQLATPVLDEVDNIEKVFEK